MKDNGVLEAFIIHYREDPDQQNLIDWIQEDWVKEINHRVSNGCLIYVSFSCNVVELEDQMIGI